MSRRDDSGLHAYETLEVIQRAQAQLGAVALLPRNRLTEERHQPCGTEPDRTGRDDILLERVADVERLGRTDARLRDRQLEDARIGLADAHDSRVYDARQQRSDARGRQDPMQVAVEVGYDAEPETMSEALEQTSARGERRGGLPDEDGDYPLGGGSIDDAEPRELSGDVKGDGLSQVVAGHCGRVVGRSCAHGCRPSQTFGRDLQTSLSVGDGKSVDP